MCAQISFYNYLSKGNSELFSTFFHFFILLATFLLTKITSEISQKKGEAFGFELVEGICDHRLIKLVDGIRVCVGRQRCRRRKFVDNIGRHQPECAIDRRRAGHDDALDIELRAEH